MSKPLKNISAMPTEQELPLNVLIIAHKYSQLASAAAFLTRRGVPCTVKGNIRDGIHHITSQKVNMVFLSWNLPNANIIKTHQLLIQHFKTECIVFAEKTDGKTAAEVTSSQLPETMQAPVSGPGIYMRIQKILKARGELYKLEKIVKPKDPQVPVAEIEDEYINLGRTPSQNTKPNFITFQNPKSNAIVYEAEEGDITGNDISAFFDKMENTKTNIITQEGQDTKTNVILQEGDKTKTNVITQKSETPKAPQHLNPDDQIHLEKKTRTKKEPASYGSVINAYKTTEPNNTFVRQDNESRKETHILDFQPRKKYKNAQSILAQKTFEALSRSVRPALINYTPVEVVSKAKIFNIHTPNFKGYLIFVVPKFNEFDRNVVASIRENLEKLLKKEEEHLLFFEEVNIDIEEKNFLGWAEENAEFFIQTVDYKTEIICAYYPYENSLPQLEELENSMSVIDIKDLKQDTKTNVNLYIHLPKNNKFVCYLRPGEMITDTHIEKFEKHKISNLHIRREEVPNFKEYFVSNQLHNIIKKKAS